MADIADRPKIQDLDKFMLFAAPNSGADKRPRLVWGVRDNNPRITVYTNLETDKASKGVIYAGINPETFYIFLNLFEKILAGPNGEKNKIDCFGTKWVDGERQEGKVLISELWFGKSAEGIAWLSLTAPDRPKIRFDLQISDYHKLFHNDGTVFTEQEGSILQAQALILGLRHAYLSYAGAVRKPLKNTGLSEAKSVVTKEATSDPAATFDDITF